MRMFIRRVTLSLGLILWCIFSIAQSRRDLRINEVLIKNTSNFQDDYGDRSAWIEIFNSAYNKVNCNGCYLTDDINNPTKYKIPMNDPNTLIPTRFFVVFWADANTTHGTFHLNFKLDSTSKCVALFDGDGKTLIDSVNLPPFAKDNVSYARIIDGDGNWQEMIKTTPMATNITVDEVSAGQKFAKSDPVGIGMAMVAMSVVFIALILLYLFFKNIGKYNVSRQKKNQEVYAVSEGKPIIHEEISGEVFAAISAALYMHETEQHDYETNVLTINRAAKMYSPWSSKIHGLRHTPQKEMKSTNTNRK